MDREKLRKMAGAVRTGGKGSVRRKKKAVHKTAATDDKRFESTLKKLSVTTISAIEEANIFVDDLVIQFAFPKVQTSVPAKTWVISGISQTKKLQDMLPGITNQLGSDNMYSLRKLSEQLQKRASDAAAKQEEDQDIPELSAGQTFEDFD